MKRYRSLTLATWLSGGSMAIVMLAVGAVAVAALGTLRMMSETAALAKAQLAGRSSIEVLQTSSEALRRSALLLAARPSLQQALLDSDRPAVSQILRSMCETSGLDVCAAIDSDLPIASTGPEVPWQEWRQAHARQGDQLLLATQGRSPIMLSAVAPVPGVADVKVVLISLVDARFLQEISGQVAATVRITGRETPTSEAMLRLHQRVEARMQPTAQRVSELAMHVASMPLLDRAESLIGFVDIELPTSVADDNLQRIAVRFGIVAIAIVGLAGLGGLVYGNWLVRPVRKLEQAARKIGSGDFTPAIAATGASEVAELAWAMDEMRGNLRRLTAALRLREAETSAVLSGVMEGVFAVDMERRIRYANPQLTRMLNLSMDAIIGRFCGDVLQPQTEGGFRPCEKHCPIITARSSNQQGQAAEQLCVAGLAPRSVVIISAPPAEGRQVQVLRDETDKEAARRARDSVLANISHEFRTPLAAQLASIEVLDESLGQLSRPEQRQLIGNVRRGGVRLMRLIDNLLESVRIESGQLAIRNQPLDLRVVLEEAASTMLPILQQRHQTLAVEIADDLPLLVGDEQRLIQVFVNLLTNASKFAPEASEIRIGAQAADGQTRAWVDDCGPGIAERDRLEIFRPFSRGTTGEPQAPGLGLGLWIAKSIIERHGGNIEIGKSRDGRNRFSVVLEAGAEVPL